MKGDRSERVDEVKISFTEVTVGESLRQSEHGHVSEVIALSHSFFKIRGIQRGHDREATRIIQSRLPF